MDADGPCAHKVIYVLLLVALTAAFVRTLKRGDEPAPEQRIEQKVAERARPRIEDAIRTARSRGDTETADWLENMLAERDARESSVTRRAAGARF
jgi:hypothetical protein